MPPWLRNRPVLMNMSKRNNDKTPDTERLKQIVELLKFVMSLDDEEIIKSTVESVIELLEEEITK